MKLQNMKVASRLAVGFGALLGMLVLTGGLGLYGMNELKTGLEGITQVNNEQIRQVYIMRATVQDRAIAIRNLVIMTDETDLKEESQRLDQNAKRYDEANAALGKLFKNDPNTLDKEYALYAAVAAAQKDALPIAARAAQLGIANQHDEALNVLVNELRPKQAAWLDRLAELVAFETELNQKAADEASRVAKTQSLTIGAAAVLALLFGVLGAYLIARSILRQLGGEPSTAQDLARAIAEGNLTRKVALANGDETSLMYSLEAMRRQLSSIVQVIKGAAESISSASSQIAQGNVDLSQRTEEQAASLEETAASMEELTTGVRQNNENAAQGSALAQSSADTAQRAGNVVGDVVSTMREIASSSSKVNEIITVIESIAFQTNILALNAAVEAARAGEQGRGFAVVASEVRGLAQRSATAAKEIKDLIQKSSTVVESGTRLVNQAGDTMAEVVTAVVNMTGLNKEIAMASHEQSAGIEQVNIAISQMDSVTQQNAALVEEAAAAAQAMAEQARQLIESVSIFKTDAARYDGAIAAHPVAVGQRMPLLPA